MRRTPGTRIRRWTQVDADPRKRLSLSAHWRPLQIQILGVALWVFLCGFGCFAAELPNILWISCEDISPDLGCYGDRYATTPSLDKLAAQGCRFTRAYVSFPVCAPSRASIITGVQPGTLGAMHMRTQFRKYEAVPPPEVKVFTEYLRAAGYYCSNHTKTDYQFAVPFTAWDALQGDWRNPDRKPGQPFFSVINLTTTHESSCFKIKSVKHDPAKAPLPPFYPDTPGVREGVAWYYDRVEQMDGEVDAILRKLREDGLDDNTVVFFWSDHGRGLPRYKRWPYETGLRVPLIVRWPGKLVPGSVNDELVCFTDLAPTVLSLAGIKAPEHMQGRVVLGKNKGPEPEYVFGGRNRMAIKDYIFIRTCRDKRFRYVRNFTPNVNYSQAIPYMEASPILQEWRRLNAAGKLTGAQKLWFEQPKPDEELYDTEADPFEVNNLAENAEYSDTLERMRAALEQWMKDTRDLGGVPESELIERFWPGHKQPVTATPVIERTDDGTVTMSCATPGASIGYRLRDNERWRIYTGPFVSQAAVHAKAIRLGYQTSEATTN
ncbi:MAG: hypothetical protein RLZZ244_547 [Verrucomicrobiota bacterium]